MSLPRAPRAVVFDMDGLLIDSEAVYRDAMMDAARDLGLDLPESLFLKLVGHVWPTNARVMRDHYGDAFDAEAFRADAVQRFHDKAGACVALKTGVREILDRLDQLGLPRAIVTSSHRAAVEKHVGGHGLLHRFDAVLAHGDYARSKPAPDPYLAAAAALGLDPADCLALEDSHVGVRAAAAAGMMTVMVPDLLAADDEMQGLCARIAADLHEVAALLGG